MTNMRNWQEKRGLLTETLSWEKLKNTIHARKDRYCYHHCHYHHYMILYIYVYLRPFLHPSKQRAHAPEKDQEL